MEIDPRIIQAIGVQPNTRTLQTFNQALTAFDANSLRKQELAQRQIESALLQQQQPLRSRLLQAQTQRAEAQVPTQEQQALETQLQQQRVESGRLAIDTTREKNRLTSVANFSLGFKPVLEKAIETGDKQGARNMLVNRLRDIKARQDAGEVIDATETQEALTALDNDQLPELLSDVNQVISVGQQSGVIDRPASAQFGAQQTFKDSEGNLFFGTTRRNPTTGAIDSVLSPIGGGAKEPVGQVSLVSGLGQTAEEKAATTVETAKDVKQAELDAELETKPLIEATTTAQKQAITKSGNAFDRIEKISTSIANLDEGIRLIDEGAETGVIKSKLPSFKKAAVELDNLQKRLGLDVIGNTTFGALSESELAFALDSALPKNLAPKDLRAWLVRKKAAQQKLSNYLSSVATFLGTPGNTVADFIEMQKVKRLDSEIPLEQSEVGLVLPPAAPAQPVAAPVSQPVSQPAAQPAAGQTPAAPTVLKFDAQGNQI